LNPGYKKQLGDDTTFGAADAELDKLKTDLVSPSWLGWSHGQVERELTVRIREVVRHLFQAHITLRAHAEPICAVIDANGCEKTHVRTAKSRMLETTFGSIDVTRTAFASRDTGAVYPVDADLNLPSHRFSHEVERLVARTAADLSYEGTAAHIEATTGADVAKRQIESITRRAAADFQAFYEARRWTPESQEDTGPFLVLSFDQKGVVVRTSELRDRTLKIAMNRTPRLRAVHNRDGKKHWRGKKRMAMVAAVYTIGPDCRTPADVVRGLRRLQDVGSRSHRTVRPELKRVWASLGQEPFDVVTEAFDDALKRDPAQSKQWLVLIDGDPDLRKWVLQAAEARGVKVTLVLDIIHVLQYLWGAGRDLCGDTNDVIEHWVLERLTRVLSGKISDVVAGMNRAATKLGLKRSQRAGVDKCAEYCLKRKDLMRYGPLLATGAPIATGVIEGTCKHLIANRCDKSGARWSIRGADAVLRLRAIKLSGDFDDYWAFHEGQEMLRNHTSRYAGNVIPVLAPFGRRTNVVRLRAGGTRRSK
jgi:hypothetical protein